MKTDPKTKDLSFSDDTHGLTLDSHDSTIRSTMGAGGDDPPASDHNTAKPAPPGLTLEQYSEWIQLPLDYLTGLGLSQIHYSGKPAVKIPYLDQGGGEVTARFLTHVPEPGFADAFAWKKKTRPSIYGLSRLHEAEKARCVVIVASEADCHVLWHHGMPCVAVTDPSALGLVEALETAAGIKEIQILQNCESTRRATAVLAESSLKEAVTLIELDGGYKSLADIHRECPGKFLEAVKAHSRKCSLAKHEAKVRQKRRDTAWVVCEDLAKATNVLDLLTDDLEQTGIVGEDRIAKLLYLAVTSRLLDRPVSVAVKGPSSCGKSATTQGVLNFFPASACHALSSMSEKALLYSPEPYAHRMLVVYELDGIRSGFGTYIIRTLLSEHCIRYEVTRNVGGELTTEVIEKEGPTGLIVTTTRPQWHEENETRMISVTVDDSPEQTARVLAAIACQEDRSVDMGAWHALQEWLELAEHRVTIPFANAIASLMPDGLPPRARRDFPTLLSLIKANAILHQKTRPRDENGWITATLDDYTIVKDLVAANISESIQESVSEVIRETVDTIGALTASSPGGVSETTLAGVLERDKSVVSRRLTIAAEAGYVTNLEPKKGCPARWVLAEPMPGDTDILPTVEQLREALQPCSGDAAA